MVIRRKWFFSANVFRTIHADFQKSRHFTACPEITVIDNFSVKYNYRMQTYSWIIIIQFIKWNKKNQKNFTKTVLDAKVKTITIENIPWSWNYLEKKHSKYDIYNIFEYLLSVLFSSWILSWNVECGENYYDRQILV